MPGLWMMNVDVKLFNKINCILTKTRYGYHSDKLIVQDKNNFSQPAIQWLVAHVILC